MFGLTGRFRDQPQEPQPERTTPTPRDVIERSIKALDSVLASAAEQPEKNWELLDRVLDERLALRPPRPSLRPSVPVIPGRAS
jgi:hypothetical protein